jgi:hypothetical protein
MLDPGIPAVRASLADRVPPVHQKARRGQGSQEFRAALGFQVNQADPGDHTAEPARHRQQQQ